MNSYIVLPKSFDIKNLKRALKNLDNSIEILNDPILLDEKHLMVEVIGPADLNKQLNKSNSDFEIYPNSNQSLY